MCDIRRIVRDEQGIVLPIVALSLIAIMGMLVLVVDVGGLLWARREMVNGSDAAALAAAQSCAKSNEPIEDAEATADEFAGRNAADVRTAEVNIIDQDNCYEGTTGFVTVRYGKDQPLFFGPVLGSGTSGNVTIEATAHWGGVGWGDGVVPLVIYSGFFQGPNCDVPHVPVGTVCTLWEDNDLSGEGNFGFIDVDQGWNVSPDDTCPNTGGDQTLEDWIDGTTVIGTLKLNYPRATWACTRDGNHSEPHVWDAVRDLIPETRTFPVVGTSPEDGNPAQLGTPKPKYNVIGFAQMQILDVLTVQDTGAQTCGPLAITASPVDLMAAGSIACGIPADSFFLRIPNGSVQGSGNITWSVTEDGVLTWSKTSGNDPGIDVRFEYTTPTTDCGGQPAPNRSAHCLVLRWNGYTFESKPVGEGGNFGAMAISLCDRDLGSCVRPGF